MPVHWVRLIMFPRGLVGLAGMVALVMCLAWPASARAAQDLCLVGTWEAPPTIGGEQWSGTLTLKIPDAAGGAATIELEASQVGSTEFKTAGTGAYSVEAGSTPDAPAGSVVFSPTDMYGFKVGLGPYLVVPTFASAYACTSTSLSLRVALTVPEVNPPNTFSANSFTRSGLGPAGLSVTTAGQGSGRVTSGSSINCSGAGGPSCSAWVPAGPVTLDAVASPGSAFTGWTGLCSGSGQVCNVALGPGEVESATARFEPMRQLTVAKAGKGDGEVSSVPSGISCPPGGSACPPASFVKGTRVTLTATPASGSVFQGWSGGCVGQTCEVSMDSDTSVTATFEPKDLVHSLDVSKEGKGAGTVHSEPAGVECGSVCSAWFLRGTPVILRANAAAGSSFGGWSGSCSGTGKCLVVMNDDESVTASFTATPAETALARDLSEMVAKLATLAHNSVLGLAFHASGPGVLTIALYDASPGGKLARMSRAKPILVGAGRHRFSGATTARISIKLTPIGKALLKRAKRLTLTAKGTFKPHGKAAVTNTETFVLRGKRNPASQTKQPPHHKPHTRHHLPSLQESEPVEGRAG